MNEASVPLTHAILQRLTEAWNPRDARLEHSAARAFVDFCACVSAGRKHLPPGWPPPGAARLAVAAHALDRDDVHWDSLTHPGSVIWPVIADLGGKFDVDGAAAVRAAALGYEVTVRLATALGPSHRRYWHATATAGIVGAAVATGILLELDLPRLVAAAGHAISVAGGSARCLVERSSTRLFHRAHAALTGAECAQAAAAGVGATKFGLEGESGLLAAMSAQSDPDCLLEPVKDWAIEQVGIRFYAANGFAHSAIDAALQVGPVNPAEIAAIRVGVGSAAFALAGDLHPVGDEAAWWSLPHAVAACLATGDARILESGRSHYPAVDRLLELISLEQTEQGLSSRVEVISRDGSVDSAEVAYPLGHPKRPLPDELLLEKWYHLTGRDGTQTLAAAGQIGSTKLRDLLETLL